MPRIGLRVIPEPAAGTRSVLAYTGEGTVVMRGSAMGHDYVCGACAAVLLEAVPRGQVRNVVVKCPACGAINDTTELPA